MLYLGEKGGGPLLLAPTFQNPLVTSGAVSRRRNKGASNILRILGVIARYNGYLPAKVLHRTNVERFSDSGEIVQDKHQITFHSQSIPFAKKGGTFTIDSQVYTLKTPLDRSDKGLQTWVIN